MIDSIATGPRPPRDSRFELLRILAMLFVLIIHADFSTLGLPTQSEAIESPSSAITKLIFDWLAMGCVNIFILISGWFGIKSSLKGVAKLLFQIVFYAIAIYFISVVLGAAPLSARGMYFGCIETCTKYQWFVPCYLLLMVFAPVLNSFVKTARPAQLAKFLITFFFLQTSLAIIGDSSQFAGGHSVCSFIGLYLLSAWLRLYGMKLRKKEIGWVLVLSAVLIGTIICFLSIKMGYQFVAYSSLINISPFVIMGSLGYIIIFSSMPKFSSPTINWISSGAFAVYLIQCNPVLSICFGDWILKIYNTLTGPIIIFAIGAFLAAVFLGCVLVDKLVREPAWKAVERAVRKYNKP